MTYASTRPPITTRSSPVQAKYTPANDSPLAGSGALQHILYIGDDVEGAAAPPAGVSDLPPWAPQSFTGRAPTRLGRPGGAPI